MKFFLFVIAVSLSFFFSSQSSVAFESKVPRELVTNIYQMALPGGDEATIYLANDGSLMFLPSVFNKAYAHLCWADWKFNEKKQIMRIRHATRCSLINGTYSLYRQDNYMYLKDGLKTLILRTRGP